MSAASPVKGSGFRVNGEGFRVQSFGFRVDFFSVIHITNSLVLVRNICVAMIMATQSSSERGTDKTVKARSWEGFRESRRCSRDTYPESYITECTLAHEDESHRNI